MASAEPQSHAAPQVTASALQGWWAVIVFLILYVVSFLDRQMISLLVGPIRQHFGISDFEVSLIQGFSFAVFYAVAGLPIGWLVDRYSRRHVIFVGLLVWATSASLCGFAQRYWQLALARLGLGAGEAALAPAAYSMLADLFPKDKLTLPMSVMGSGAKLGGAVATLVGGFMLTIIPEQGMTLPALGHYERWQVALILTGVPGLLLAPLIFTIHDPRQRLARGDTRPGGSPAATWRILRANARFYSGHFVGFGCVSLCGYAVLAWAPTFFVRRFGYTLTEAAFTFGSITLVTSLFGSVLVGWIVDRWYARGRRDAHLVFFAANILIQAALIAGAMLTPNPHVAIVLIAAQQVLLPFTGVAGACLQIFTPEAVRGQVSAIYLLVFNLLGIGLGPSIVAAFTDFVFRDDAMLHYSIASTFALAGVVAASCLFLAARPMRDREGKG